MKRGSNQSKALGIAYILGYEPLTDEDLIGRQIVYADGPTGCYTQETALIVASDVAKARAYIAGHWKPKHRLAAQRMTAYLVD